MTEETEQKLVDFIKKWYKPHAGAYTCMRSAGNDDDVFSDGEARGEADTLSTIAAIIGLDVEPLEEQKFDF